MSRSLVPPETPSILPGFEPETDMLVFALPEDPQGGLDHSLDFRHDRRAGFLEVVLTHAASGARFRVRLPGLSRLDPASIAVVSLEAAERLVPSTRTEDSATLTGEGVYPAEQESAAKGPRRIALLHRHDWYRDGPPPERFYDLSDPRSELDIRLDTTGGGPVYAIRLTERGQSRSGARPSPPGDPLAAEESSDIHRSIVLVQSAPGAPALTPGLLAQWFETRLGSAEFRAIAWIWLGNEGHYTDPASGRIHRFGRINRRPQLAIHGPIARSIALDR